MHARARHPRPLPSPFARKRCARGAPPLPAATGPSLDRPTPAPPFHIRTAEGRTACRRPFPLDLTAPYAREGGTRPPGPSLPHSCGRGDTAPLSRVAPAPAPPSLPSSRRVRGQAAPSRGAPFAREGAHEAKPTPPPYVSRSGAGAVSVRPRSPRHSTT
ncbi:hypothetical protein EDB84DRAFT_1565447 [Lactarius hengduanensis]|nr:hypothetical protein EDB84DRAFT_1565447 [Lactarius hengduanensis]